MATLIVFCDAGTGSTTVDGRLSRTGVDESFATIRAGAGTIAENTLTNVTVVSLQASTTLNQFQTLRRGIFTFDTSALTSSATISAVTLSLTGSGSTPAVGAGATSMHITSASPASNNTLVASDFSNVGETSFASIPTGSYLSTGYNDFVLNASGIANVSLTGISRFGSRIGWDMDNSTTGFTWASGAFSAIGCTFADQTGTTSDPKLTITYTLPSTNYTKLMLLGVG